ncbi:MAG: His-Xaa-Ser system protein HxsD [Vulcanimicrobiota bacterium]
MPGFKEQFHYQFPIDSSIYSVQAVLRAAYWLTERCYFHVTRSAEGHYLVHMAPKSDNPEPLEQIAAEFSTSLIDQQLRIELAESSRTVRDLIVAKAFAEGDLLDDPIPGDALDPVASGEEWDRMVNR